MRKKPKNSRENSKLKKKTQNSRTKLNVSEDCPSPDLPSDVKKKPDIGSHLTMKFSIKIGLVTFAKTFAQAALKPVSVTRGQNGANHLKS